MNIAIILIFALWFGFLSFLLVFMITCDRRVKQNAPQGRMAKDPLRTALGAFIFFFCLAVIVGWAISFIDIW